MYNFFPLRKKKTSLTKAHGWKSIWVYSLVFLSMLPLLEVLMQEPKNLVAPCSFLSAYCWYFHLCCLYLCLQLPLLKRRETTDTSVEQIFMQIQCKSRRIACQDGIDGSRICWNILMLHFFGYKWSNKAMN